MKNQLQKDIETALEWYRLLSNNYTDETDAGAYHRLKTFVDKKGTEYLKYDMKKLIKEAIEHERTDIGQSVLKQLLERI